MALDISSYLLGKSKGGGGTTPTLINKNISENGTYNASDDEADGYKKVVVNVPQPSGTINITENGTVDVTDYVSANVNVSADLSEYMGSSIGTVSSWQEGSGVDRIIKKLPSLTASGTSLNYAFHNLENLEEIESLDTTGVTSMEYTFQNCSKLKSIPTIDTSAVTNMYGTFAGCKEFETIQTLNTSNVTTVVQMFYNCSKLKNVPLLDTSSITGNTLGQLFGNCPLLTDTSLDNILQMCINATSYTGNKKLSSIGISTSYYSTSRIEALPHYQDFIGAGWTIS